jgi:excisionase family DNA binding protein
VNGAVAETISLKEAASRLDVHYMTAYRYVRNGRLPAHKVGDMWRVDPADLGALRPTSGRAPAKRGSPDRGETRNRLEGRMLAGDEAGAWSIMEAAGAAGASPEDILTALLAPVMDHIGKAWSSGDLSIADEHRATAVAQRLVARLGPSFVRPGRRRGTVVLGSVAGDSHALPSAILSDLLRGEMFEVLDLGPNTPAESFVATAASADRLHAIGVCVSDSALLDSIPAFVRAVRAGVPGVPIYVGGGAIESEAGATAVGSDGFAATTTDVVALFSATSS